MTKLNLRGIWIPIEILEDKKLSDKEKIIYSIIVFLTKEKEYCYCTNSNISKLLNISITQVSKLVKSLKEKEYVETEIIYKENTRQIEIRKLKPKIKNGYLTKVKYSYYKKLQYPIKEKFKKENNNKNKYINNKIIDYKETVKIENRDYSELNFSEFYAN